MSRRHVIRTLVLGLSGCGGLTSYAEGLQALHDGSYRPAARHLARAFRSLRDGRVGMEFARACVLSGKRRAGLRAAERAWRAGVRGSDVIEFALSLPAGEARERWLQRTLDALEATGRGACDLAACVALVEEYEAFPDVVLRACRCARRRFRELARGRALSGLGYELEGDAQAAEREYRSSFGRDPGCREAAKGLGLVLARTGRKQEAAALALRFIRSDPSLRGRLIAAEVALETGSRELADEILAAQLSSGGEPGARAAAVLSLSRSLPKERLKFLLQARSRGLDCAELRRGLVEAYSVLGRTQEMLREGRRALGKYPDAGILALRLAELGEAWGEAELAEAALRALGPRARTRLANELARSGKGKEALRAARSPGAGGLTARAVALASCGKVRAAAKMLEEARDSRALHELAWLKLALGELEEALRAWRSALAVEPGFGPARSELRRWRRLRGSGPGGTR